MSDLLLLKQRVAVCRLAADEAVPAWVKGDELTVITRTPEELSMVCDERWVPVHIRAENGWRILKVQGPLDFNQVGVLSAIAIPLAQAGVSIFAISTFDTDFILVKESALTQAMNALQDAGHKVDAE